MNWLSGLYSMGRPLNTWPSGADHPVVARKQTDVVVTLTLEFNPESFLLVPAALAIYFMLWVLWHWWREEKRARNGGHRA
jgi:hypothetical protein